MKSRDDNLTDDDVRKQWPHFRVICMKCKSTRVRLDNSLGFSETSGSWGSIDFVCLRCGTSTEIVQA